MQPDDASNQSGQPGTEPTQQTNQGVGSTPGQWSGTGSDGMSSGSSESVPAQQPVQPWSPDGEQAGVSAQPASEGAPVVSPESQAGQTQPNFAAQPTPPSMSAPETYQQPATPPAPQAWPDQAAPQPVMGGAPAPMAPEPPKAKSRTWLIIVLTIVGVLIVLGVIGYFLQKNTNNKTASNANNAARQAQAASGASDISKLSSFTFEAPAASQLNGMQPSTAANGLTAYASADAKCELGFGKVAQNLIAGTDVGDVVAKVIQKVKGVDPSVKVTGPNNVAARVLKGSDGKSYSLPTVNFAYSGTTSSVPYAIDVTYSVSQLSDGSHAVILEECTDTGTTDTSTVSSRVTALDPVANAVQVKVGS